MNTKNNRNEKIITSLLSVIALAVAVVGCSVNKSEPTANTAAPATTATTANTPASANTATAENPAMVFYGAWEKKEADGQPFRYEKFGEASKQDNKYVGKVTDQRNVVVANYTVFNDKTVEIAYLPEYYEGTTYTYGYKFSDGGNKLTLDANPPIVYTKGTANTSIQKDATFLASGTWRSAKDPSRELSFTDPKQNDKGWGGNFVFMDNGTTGDVGTFTMTEAGKMTLMDFSSGGSKTYTYKIRGDNLFDFTRDSTGDTDSYTK